ncbi:UDP-N-acetylmuramoyl-L-alanyl-D-glutamate--2,6-diaminopimelate ligase [Pseudonocardia sp. HH130630-07]|uniref:UDP-N-acetylmuramoyl-L-alanyl-D-glutamate--2, 6-diaminopimelate ligase n=1 Tax=Pseudonocardia sp. HH130630-07 TaxID=1690815 RepID=UPI000815374E|nr:UDP-N-acetylmuramoyl-L-alanyl-D-glutamate--2,6-diaminopimelate ligase [Pseudonocardia sp. HH130630-07]ANY09678.1 UDP-N-acetylmuramoyl-L-alanyl-D-glutamate--2,6-diaminopimelate ligase [Pseudonocardia sp. HH130630-07]
MTRDRLPDRPEAVRPVDIALLGRFSGALLNPRTAGAGPGPLLDAATGGHTVTGVTLRAGSVRPGDLFAAVPGARVHGADFAAQAIAGGAAAVLTDPDGADRPEVRHSRLPVLVHPDPREVLGPVSAAVYGEPTARLRVLGVTGTSGKTTVGHLIEAGLAAAGRATGLLGTVRTRVRVPGAEPRALASAFTTPEAPDLQALFAVMVEAGVTDVAMEVSSHALAMGRVGGSRFAVGAFTNLSQDHLDFHPTMTDYFEAKARLFGGGGRGVEAARHGVVCVDDEWGRRLAARHPDAVTVSADPSASGSRATWTVRELTAHPDGTQTFTAVGPGGLAQAVTLALPGRYNVANALVALACLDADGIGPETAAAGFARLSVPGRMQRVDAGQPWLGVVDYAHKPAAVAALLDALRAQVEPHARIITVLGCGGDRDTGKRPLMGAAAAVRSDLLVVTDDNPRGEEPGAIRRAVLDGALQEPARGDVVEVGDRRSAIVHAVRSARPGDAVVIAGKGHETGQEVHGVKYPFDDADELDTAIRAIS